MKEKLKNVALVALAGLSAFFMKGGCSGDAPGNVASNVQTVYQLDTLFQYIFDEEQPVHIVTVHDTIRETVIIREPVPVDTPVLILYADELDPDRDMALYEGRVEGDSGRCIHTWQAGVSGDTLTFLAIESDCAYISSAIEVAPPPLTSFLPGNLTADPRLLLGGKAGWSPNVSGLQYGVQGVYRGVYGSANYAPAKKAWLFEVGALIPLGKPKEPPPVVPDMN